MVWNTLKFIFSTGPKIWALCIFLKGKIQSWIKSRQNKKSLEKFKTSLVKAEETKDTSDLEELFRG